MNLKFQDKLSKRAVFIERWVPYDFTKNMGFYAVDVFYTDGDKDTLTTKSTNPNVHQKWDFQNEEEFFSFLDFLSEYKKRSNDM